MLLNFVNHLQVFEHKKVEIFLIDDLVYKTLLSLPLIRIRFAIQLMEAKNYINHNSLV